MSDENNKPNEDSSGGSFDEKEVLGPENIEILDSEANSQKIKIDESNTEDSVWKPADDNATKQHYEAPEPANEEKQSTVDIGLGSDDAEQPTENFNDTAKNNEKINNEPNVEDRKERIEPTISLGETQAPSGFMGENFAGRSGPRMNPEDALGRKKVFTESAAPNRPKTVFGQAVTEGLSSILLSAVELIKMLVKIIIKSVMKIFGMTTAEDKQKIEEKAAVQNENLMNNISEKIISGLKSQNNNIGQSASLAPSNKLFEEQSAEQSAPEARFTGRGYFGESDRSQSPKKMAGMGYSSPAENKGALPADLIRSAFSETEKEVRAETESQIFDHLKNDPKSAVMDLIKLASARLANESIAQTDDESLSQGKMKKIGLAPVSSALDFDGIRSEISERLSAEVLKSGIDVDVSHDIAEFIASDLVNYESQQDLELFALDPSTQESVVKVVNSWLTENNALVLQYLEKKVDASGMGQQMLDGVRFNDIEADEDQKALIEKMLKGADQSGVAENNAEEESVKSTGRMRA